MYAIYLLAKCKGQLLDEWIDDLMETDYFEAVEICSNCIGESIYPMYDAKKDGYVVKCKHRGEEMLLCSECLNAEDNPTEMCDWCETETGGKCFRGETHNRQKETQRYKIASIKELMNMLIERGFDESVDFTFDEEPDTPSEWYGVKRVNLFDERKGCVAIGYYGGGCTSIREIEDDTTYGLESLLKEILSEISPTGEEVKAVCVDLYGKNGE